MRIEHALRVRVCLVVRLPDDGALELGRTARDLAPDARERRLERPLSQPREVVLRAPEEVRVREEERRLAVLLPAGSGQAGITVLRRVGPQHAALGEQQVGYNLDVECPVTGVVEYEYGVNFGIRRSSSSGSR